VGLGVTPSPTVVWDASTTVALDTIVTKYDNREKSVVLVGMNEATTDFRDRLSGGLGGER